MANSINKDGPSDRQKPGLPVLLSVFEEVNFLNVKSDHHSKFSNLSNWKEEA